MTNSENLAQLEELFDLDPGSLQPETELDGLEEWDSVNKLSLIILLDEKYEVIIDGNDIKEFKNINDILKKMAAGSA